MKRKKNKKFEEGKTYSISVDMGNMSFGHYIGTFRNGKLVPHRCGDCIYSYKSPHPTFISNPPSFILKCEKHPEGMIDFVGHMSEYGEVYKEGSCNDYYYRGETNEDN